MYVLTDNTNTVNVSSAKGPTGDTGNTGTQGATGAQGAQGNTGPSGADDYSKIDVSLDNTSKGYYETTSSKLEVVSYVLFPGTSIAPNFTKVRVALAALTFQGDPFIAKIVLNDSAGNEIASSSLNISGTAVSSTYLALEQLTTTGIFPVAQDVLTLEAQIAPPISTLGGKDPVNKLRIAALLID